MQTIVQMVKESSVKRHINRLKELYARSKGQFLFHGTEHLPNIAQQGKINTPLRMVHNNPSLLMDNPLAGYANTRANPAFMQMKSLYANAPAHMRGEARKGYMNYIANRETDIGRQFRQYFGNKASTAAEHAMGFELALGKSPKWVSRKLFNTGRQSTTGRELLEDLSLEGANTKRGKRILERVTKANRDRHVAPSALGSDYGYMPRDSVSFGDSLKPYYGSQGVLIPGVQNKRLHIVNKGTYRYDSEARRSAWEYVHGGPYTLGAGDLVIAPTGGLRELKGKPYKSVSIKARNAFLKKNPDAVFSDII